MWILPNPDWKTKIILFKKYICLLIHVCIHQMQESSYSNSTDLFDYHYYRVVDASQLSSLLTWCSWAVIPGNDNRDFSGYNHYQNAILQILSFCLAMRVSEKEQCECWLLLKPATSDGGFLQFHCTFLSWFL